MTTRLPNKPGTSVLPGTTGCSWIPGSPAAPRNDGKVRYPIAPGCPNHHVTTVTYSVGFPPIARADARVLILGSLPGAESLRQQLYYAKPQNSFWTIMGALVGAAPALPYEERLEALMAHGIALWDVCASAHRVGSLDSAIETPVANDFAGFFEAHPAIAAIFFNGQPAAKLFTRHVVPSLPEPVAALPRMILPSTSPAHAGMRVEQKLALWRAALESKLH